MVNDDDGAEYPMRAVYAEVTEPERLVWIERDVFSEPFLVVPSESDERRMTHSLSQLALERNEFEGIDREREVE